MPIFHVTGDCCCGGGGCPPLYLVVPGVQESLAGGATRYTFDIFGTLNGVTVPSKYVAIRYLGISYLHLNTPGNYGMETSTFTIGIANSAVVVNSGVSPPSGSNGGLILCFFSPGTSQHGTPCYAVFALNCDSPIGDAGDDDWDANFDNYMAYAANSMFVPPLQ